MIKKLKNMTNDEFQVWLGLGIKIMIGLVSVVLLIELLKLICNLYQDYKIRKKMVVLKILPKKSIDLKETERLIKNLHSMLINTQIRKYLFGRQYMSFEIGAKQGKINFYIAVPIDMKDRIVDRIYSSYSEVAIEITEEYIPDIKGLSVYTSELKLGYHHTLKLKTQDILGSLLSAMVELDSKDFVGIQVLFRPVDNSWQSKGRKDLARFEKEGIRPGQKRSFGEKASDALISIEQELIGKNKSTTIIGMVGGLKKTKLDRKEIVVVSEKISDVGFDTIIRLVAVGKFRKGNTARIKAIVAAFTEVNAENKFKRIFISSHKYIFARYKKRMMHLEDKKNILVPSELSSFILRLPGDHLLQKYREIDRLVIKEFPVPTEAVDTGKGNVFALNRYRAVEKLVEIKDVDLVRHLVVQGKTGTGKSEWMKTLFINQISNKYDENGKLIKKGRGAMVLEPHGKLANELLDIIPEDRRKDVIEFDLYSDHPWAFNFCKVPNRESDILTADQLAQKTLDEAIEIFKRSFSDVWSEKNEFYIENAVRAIMDAELTMLELPRMFTDKKFRDSVIPRIKDKKVKSFWIDKFKPNAQGKIDSSVESTAQSVEYKLDKFLRSKELQRTLGQNDCIDFKEILDNNKIIIFKFSKDKMSKDKITFIGGIAMKLLIVAAFSRDQSMWGDPFTIFVDEAQNFINESIKDVLYELRKYGIGLILMHQELEQMKEVPGLINAIYNNVGTSITFTTGEGDAPFFTKKYSPRVDEDDLTNLPSRHGYCKLMINGKTSDTFNIYSIDSPKVTAEEAAKSVQEITKYNAEGKMSADELDKMIAERYEDEDYENSSDLSGQAFAINIDEEENIEADSRDIEDEESRPISIIDKLEDKNKEEFINIKAEDSLELVEEEKKVNSYWD